MLYGRDGFLDELMAPLIGLDLAEDRRLTLGRGGDIPVVLLTGGHGMGKSALLGALASGYGNRAPLVRLDLAAKPSWPDVPLAGIFKDLIWDLQPRVRWGGELHFPRLALALLTITTWPPDQELDRDAARARLAASSDRVAEIGRAHQDGWISDWIPGVLSELPGALVPFPANVFLKASIRVFSKKALGAFDRREPVNWHERFNPRIPGDGYDALIRLAQDFHHNEDSRVEEAGETLMAAFLADIAARYRRMAPSSLKRVARPLILLDNISANPAGTRFLDLLLKSRARSGSAHPGSAHPPVTVAACYGDVRRRYPHAQHLAVTDLYHRWKWERHGAEPDAGLLVVEMTPLTRKDVGRMLDEADQRRLPPELGRLIHRLTGGFPLAADAITQAVADAAPTGSPDGSGTLITPASLLTLPVSGGASTELAPDLLRRLIPDERWRARLVVLAAARDSEAAEALVAARLFSGHTGLLIPETEEFLRDHGWGPGPEFFVNDPFLRYLLLRELHQPRLAKLWYPSWARVHVALRDHYDPGQPGLVTESTAHRLRHCLALDEGPRVVGHLSNSFGSPAKTWIAALCRIAHAPGFGSSADRRAVALGAADAAVGNESALYRSVNRLLHAAWYLSDPLTAPDAEVIDKLATELRFLAEEHRVGNRILFIASRAWPESLSQWQQDCRWLDQLE